MESEEFVELVAKAITSLTEELRATQVVQQLIAMQLSQLAPDHARELSNTLENIAGSESVETNEVTRHHLRHVSRFLKGEINAPIIGLLKPEPEPERDDPVHWFRGIIRGSKE